MWTWIVENVWTIVISLGVIALVAQLIRTLIKERKSGKSCCGSCASCASCSACSAFARSESSNESQEKSCGN